MQANFLIKSSINSISSQVRQFRPPSKPTLLQVNSNETKVNQGEKHYAIQKCPLCNSKCVFINHTLKCVPLYRAESQSVLFRYIVNCYIVIANRFHSLQCMNRQRRFKHLNFSNHYSVACPELSIG